MVHSIGPSYSACMRHGHPSGIPAPVNGVRPMPVNALAERSPPALGVKQMANGMLQELYSRYQFHLGPSH